jgi:hypothetical protein
MFIEREMKDMSIAEIFDTRTSKIASCITILPSVHSDCCTVDLQIISFQKFL